jgi:translation initiation factor 3 subunit D
MPAGFQVPGIVENEEGWGPTTVPEHLEGVPYAPYGKGDKVGRVSDFTQSGFNKYGGRYRSCILTHRVHSRPEHPR